MPKRPRVKAGTSKRAAAARRKAFAQAYIANGRNGTQAAITAGYSENGADVAAVRLLGNPRVKTMIDEMTLVAEQASGLTTENVLREVRRLSFSDMRQMLNPDGTMKAIKDLSDDAAATLASLEVDEIRVGGIPLGQTKKFKVWDKPRALDMAMKHLGLFERDNAQRGDSLAIQIVAVGKAER